MASGGNISPISGARREVLEKHMKVLLFANVGTSEEGFYHVGDEAMFLEMYRFYRKRFPDWELSAIVSLPLYADLKVTEQRMLPWPDTRNGARLYFVKLLLKLFIWTRFSIDLFRKDPRSFIQFINRHDLVHFTGGGNITSETKHWLYFALLVASVAHMLKKPVVMTSQSIGPFVWICRIIAACVLKQVKILGIREHSESTVHKLRNMGITRPKVVQSVDAAYFIPASRVKSRKKTGSIRIGLSVHEKDKNGERLSHTIQQALRLLAQRKQPVELVVLPHVMTENEKAWDTGFINHVVRPFRQSMTVIQPSYYQLSRRHIEIAQLVKGYTKTCDIVISTRYHGLVFALSQNIPAVTIVDGEYQIMKNLEVLRFLYNERATRYSVDLADERAADIICSSVDLVLKNRTKLRTHLKKRNAVLKKQHTAYLDRLAKQIPHIKE